MIFDEATSSVDTETERAIKQNLSSEIKRLKTAFIIAHRLSTIRHADAIHVLRWGNYGIGSHDNLIEKKR